MHASSPPIRPAATRWRPTAFIKASVACHVGAAVTVASQPALWPWALGAVALDHALITATGLWPRSTWLGSNLRQLPKTSVARGEVALTIDDGPDPQVTPAVLDLLDAHSAHATFFCIAAHAQAHPQLCREIVRRGHSVQNHSHSHSHRFSLLGPGGIAREIESAQDSLSQITGQAPRFFRAPAGLRNVFLEPVLHRLDMQLVSWTRRGFDTTRSLPATVLTRLTHGLAAGDIVLLHDGNAALASNGKRVVLEVLPDLLERFAHGGLRTVTLPQAMQAEAQDITHAQAEARA